MLENSKEITIGGKPYRLIFNVVALKAIVERYGGLEELGDVLDKDFARAMDEYTWLTALLASQGIAIRNFEEGKSDPPITMDQVNLLMRPRELIGQKDVLLGAIHAGMDSGSDTEAEEVDEVLEEVLASKNGAGAEG